MIRLVNYISYLFWSRSQKSKLPTLAYLLLARKASANNGCVFMKKSGNKRLMDTLILSPKNNAKFICKNVENKIGYT